VAKFKTYPGGLLMVEKDVKKPKSDFDEFIESLQAEMDADAEMIFSKKVMEEYKDPQNVGRISNPDGIGMVTGPCGDTMEFYIHVKNSRIEDIKFMTDGCGATIACGSKTTKMVKGKSLRTVSKLTNNDLINALDGLPDENLHCAKLSIDTLHKTIDDYLIKKGKE
jgi:nitrogen fixation NifU-like protein